MALILTTLIASIPLSGLLVVSGRAGELGSWLVRPWAWISVIVAVLVLSLAVLVGFMGVHAEEAAHRRSLRLDTYPCGSLLAPEQPAVADARSECDDLHANGVVVTTILLALGLSVVTVVPALERRHRRTLRLTTGS
jgi:hypothetical protein